MGRIFSMTIGKKLTFFFVLFLLIAFIPTIIIINMEMRDSMEDIVGRESEQHAITLAENIDTSISRKYHEVLQLSLEMSIVDQVNISNEHYDGMNGMDQFIQDKNEQWRTDAGGINFTEDQMSTNISSYLEHKYVEYYLNNHGYSIFSNVFILNRFGLITAMTASPPSKFDFSGADWFPDVMGGYPYISEIKRCPSTNRVIMTFAQPIEGGHDGGVIGVAVASVYVSILTKEAEIGYDTDMDNLDIEVRLITEGGKLLHYSNTFSFFENVSDMDLYKGIDSDSGNFLGEEYGKKKCYAYSYTDGHRGYNGQKMILITSQDREVIYEPIEDVTSFLWILVVIVLAVGVVLSLAISYSFQRPIRKLEKVTRDLANGDLNRRAMIRSRDEIGGLADSFNEMAETLQVSRDDLEKKVQERTRALTEENEQRKRVEEDLRKKQKEIIEQMKRTKTIIDSISGVFYQIDSDGRFVEVNETFERVSRYSRKELLNTITPLDLYEGEDKINVASAMKDVFTKGVGEVRADLMAKDGTKTPFLLSGTLLSISGKNYIVGMGLDITQVEKARKDLVDSVQKLEETNSVLERFAYVASHDLQEPLRKLMNYSELLSKRYQGNLDDRGNRYVDHIIKDAKRMQTLITDLRSYSRAATIERKISSVDLEELLKEVLYNLSYDIKEHGITVSRDHMPFIAGNSMEMKQIFQNLISNAIKYRKGEKPILKITAKEIDAGWEFCVEDNGIGFEMKYADQIFIPFKRLHSRAEYPGTGIGLALCKRLIEKSGGRIWVESQPGKGSKFHFTVIDKDNGGIQNERK